MWIRLSFVTFLLCCCCVSARAQSKWQACLPGDVKAEEVVSAERPRSGRAVKQITVKQTLKQLNARCRGGKLVDAKRREIYFYRLNGCWGNPPSDYLEILERQREEIKKLKRRYTVIEMTCNPTGDPVP